MRKLGRQEQEAAEVQPVGEVVEAGERHVGRADHQRDQVVAQTGEGERTEEDEQHDRAVHREQLVVDVLGHEVVVRHDELGADALGQQPGEQEPDKRRDQVVEADLLVVGAGDVFDEAGRAGPGHDLHQCRLGGDHPLFGAILDEGHELLVTPAVVVEPGICFAYQAW